jgi:hypothetical protein
MSAMSEPLEDQAPSHCWHAYGEARRYWTYTEWDEVCCFCGQQRQGRKDFAAEPHGNFHGSTACGPPVTPQPPYYAYPAHMHANYHNVCRERVNELERKRVAARVRSFP